MRAGLAIAVLLALAGCSSGDKKAVQTDSRVERCTQRFLDRIGGDAKIRSYVQRTYCEPFTRKGWVYADGTLSIGAQLYVLGGTACSAVRLNPGGSTTTIPCDRRPLYPLDCAVLQYVRRNEVRTYLHKLERSHTVSCDDGTPLDKLGAR
ncbi:MAG TPA: hypothetical protein VK488_12105 [Gaiellaceae bacterium]|nr:hypothetical protein [Gaiellaceae bacterium]